jgi:hypothetical protein
MAISSGFWVLNLVFSFWSVPVYWVDVPNRQYSVSIQRERRKRSTALASQSIYDKRTIPPLVKEETLLPSTDSKEIV